MSDRKPPLPTWDAGLRELRFRNRLVKSFRVPANGQEAVLNVFQLAGWPRRVEPALDSLPMDQQQLHDAVRRLNERQANELLLFRRDGTGRGVQWLEREEESEKSDD